MRSRGGGCICINYVFIVIYNNRIPGCLIDDYFIGNTQNSDGFNGRKTNFFRKFLAVFGNPNLVV